MERYFGFFADLKFALFSEMLFKRLPVAASWSGYRRCCTRRQKKIRPSSRPLPRY